MASPSSYISINPNTILHSIKLLNDNKFSEKFNLRNSDPKDFSRRVIEVGYKELAKLVELEQQKVRRRDSRAMSRSQFFWGFQKGEPVGLRDMETEQVL